MSCLSFWLSSWLQTALDFAYPAECVYCHHFVGDDRVLIFCRACWENIPLITLPVCPRCGKPFSSEVVMQYSPDFMCGDCRKTLPYFDRTFTAGYYEDVLKEAIHQFKFQQKTRLGKHLAQLLVAQIPMSLDMSHYDIILPVPLHKTRQRQRGYNQSAILAKYVARHYQRKLMLNNLIRIRDTSAQSLVKGRRERKNNVKNAFHVKFPSLIHHRHVVLIDDVFTTGATVNECSKVLKKAGARSVLVLTLSRAGFVYHSVPHNIENSSSLSI